MIMSLVLTRASKFNSSRLSHDMMRRQGLVYYRSYCSTIKNNDIYNSMSMSTNENFYRTRVYI